MTRIVMLAGTLIAVATVAAAEPAATPQDPKAAETKTICRNISEVGSRLNRRRVCATRAQWDEMEAQNRLALDRVQTGRQTTGN